MKKYILSALLLMAASVQAVLAQGFRVYKSDGTVAQFSFRTDSIVFYDGIGSDADFGPFTPVNQCIVGTWYKSKSETVTFNEDSTTDYMEGATYKFFPYQGTIIIYNASDTPVNIFKVHEVTAERMIVTDLSVNENFFVMTRMKPVVLVKSITLSETSLTLQPDEIKNLIATVLPEDADNKTVTWESSDGNVAEVNRNGRVIANSNGTCTITCRTTDESGVYAECTVTVSNIQPVTSITLNKTSLSLSLPNNKTQTLTATILPANATNNSVTWSSNKTSVATVDQSGKVTAVAEGSCTVTCTAQDGSGAKATCSVIVDYTRGYTNGHEWVDLGLPSGTLWATCNVGASNPEDYGNYYAWGETTNTKTTYNWNTYRYCNGSLDTLTKYCTQTSKGNNGFTDGLTELLPMDDAATANWGNNWQMPSLEQCEELLSTSYTITEWTIMGGVYGRKITSKSNGEILFLPAAGYRAVYSVLNEESYGYYWSRSLWETMSQHARSLSISSTDIKISFGERQYGRSVRPVRKQ